MTALDLENLAVGATTCMVCREPVACTHGPGWKRPPNWPLPIRKGTLAPDGTLTQTYRPIAILEYVDGALAALAALDREAAPDDDDDDDLA